MLTGTRLALLLMITALVIVAAVIGLLLQSGAPSGRSRENSIIHVPASGRCPEGFKREPAFFTESDGSTRDACVSHATRDNGEGTIDRLEPGESFSMHMHVPIPLPAPEAGPEVDRRQL